MEYYNQELYHYGIKGMRWGVRRFQKEDGTLTNAGKKRYSDDNSTKPREDSNQERKGLTDKQKRAIKIGAAVVGTALITYGAYKISKSGVLDKYIKTGRDKLGSLPDIPGLKQKTMNTPRSMMTIQKDLQAVNPSGDKTNCVACSVAYNLRKMGYDVSAKSRGNGKLFGWGEVELAFDDFKMDRFKPKSKDVNEVYKELTKSLEGFGEGSSGVLSGTFNEKVRNFLKSQNATFDGHAVSWEVLNGKVLFTDGQSAKIFDDPMKQLFRLYDSNTIKFGRMDNLIVDPENAMFIKALVE